MNFRVAVTGPQRYCRVAVMSLLWPTIVESVRSAHGPICARCIAAVLALPSPLVIMATLGLRRLGMFEVADGMCSRCGARVRVLSSCQAHIEPQCRVD